jgi:tetratricopeptide (TPR) repeat protein
MTESEKILQTELFERASLPVAPMMERALGYTGERRYVAFHWSTRWNSLCWADSPFNSARSGSKVWRRFLTHPVIAPYLQHWTSHFTRVEPISFEAKDGGIIKKRKDLSPDEEAALKELGVALLLDRQERVAYVAAWLHVCNFLLVPYMDECDDAEESGDVDHLIDGVDYGDEPVPVVPALEEHLLAWLTERLNDPEELYGLATVHYRFGQFQEALEFLRRALKFRPKSDLLYYRLSQVYGSLESWEEALEACAEAVRLEGSSGRHEYTTESLFMWRALCLVRLKRYADAIETYKFVLQVRPDKFEAYREMGGCYAVLQQHASAIDAYEREVQQRSADGLNFTLDEMETEELSEAYQVLGEAYLRNNQVQEARWACEQGVRVSPDSAEAHAALAEVYKRLGDDQQARKEYERAAELGSKETDS